MFKEPRQRVKVKGKSAADLDVISARGFADTTSAAFRQADKLAELRVGAVIATPGAALDRHLLRQDASPGRSTQVLSNSERP